MGQMPLTTKPLLANLLRPAWFSSDLAEEEEKELWMLEKQVIAEMSRVDQRYSETLPIGKSENEPLLNRDEDDDDEKEDGDRCEGSGSSSSEDSQETNQESQESQDDDDIDDDGINDMDLGNEDSLDMDTFY